MSLHVPVSSGAAPATVPAEPIRDALLRFGLSPTGTHVDAVQALSAAANAQAVCEVFALVAIAWAGATRATVTLWNKSSRLVVSKVGVEAVVHSWASETTIEDAPHASPTNGMSLALTAFGEGVGMVTIDFPDDAGMPDWRKALHALSAQAALLIGADAFSRKAAGLMSAKQDCATALRETLEFMNTSQQLSRTGSWRWNPTEPDAEEWSLEMFNILGYDPARTKACTAANLARVHPDDRTRYQDAVAQALLRGERLNLEYRYVLPDGRVRYVHAMGRRISPTLYVGTVSDVSDHQAAQKAVHNALAELAGASRLTTLGGLAASITHELNQPLTAMAAEAGASLRWLSRDPPDLARATEGMEALAGDVRRAREVVASLHALARKSEPQFGSVLVDEAAAQVLNLIRSELDLQRVAIQTFFNAGDRRVPGDRIQLQQVMLSLLVSSLARLEGVTDRTRGIAFGTTAPSGARLSLTITDSGRPIAPDELPGHISLTGSLQGLGQLELSICRSIVEAHGGTLVFHRTPSQHTVAEVTLPCSEP